MDKFDVLHGGALYDPGDRALLLEQFRCLCRLHRFNRMHPLNIAGRQRLLKKMFAELGEGCYVTPPFYANWGGRHVHFGAHVYANSCLTIVDDTHVYVGDCTQFGPNVTIAAAGHPILPELRGEAPLQFNLPVRIGKNCWIGAGAILVPGVTVGDETVIGAGAVVTKDIPAGVVAAGNPCRVLRQIGERDRAFYYRDRPIDPALLGTEASES